MVTEDPLRNTLQYLNSVIKPYMYDVPRTLIRYKTYKHKWDFKYTTLD